MSDNLASVPIKTKNAGDAIVALVDAGGVNKGAIDSHGSLSALLKDSTGTDLGTSGNPIFVEDVNGSQVVLDAGSAIIGKVGIDQTTPGTTNGVQITGPGTSSGNPLFVNTGSSGTTKNSGKLTIAGLAVNTPTALAAAAVTTGKQGSLGQVVVSSGVPLKIEIQTVNNTGTATTQLVAWTTAATPTFTWRQIFSDEIQTVASADGTNNKFQLLITNEDVSTVSDVYANISWKEN